MSQCNDQNSGCDTVQIVQTAQTNIFSNLFRNKFRSPFDLTGATEVAAIFPGSNGTPVIKTLSGSGGVTIVGAPGAGKIQVALSSTDTAAMLANPQIGQNLQIVATIDGVAQVDAISFESPPIAGTTYTITLNGIPSYYHAKSGDDAEDVLSAIAISISLNGLPVSPVVSGSGDEAILTLTAGIAGLGFTDSVSSGMEISNLTANSGSRTIFLLQQVLNIQPQDYSGV